MADSAAALRDSVETSTFASLRIWRDKLQADLAEPARPGGFKLRMLLEQGKDVEIAVQGCLKDGLFELSEAVHWGLLDPVFADQQRLALYSQAAVELGNDKQLCLALAREHGVQADYARELKRRINRTVADYERIGDLKFSLLVWRTNLLTCTSLMSTGEEVEGCLREAYYDALRLIRHCVSKSARFWAVQRAAGDTPAQLDAAKQRVYTAAVQLVQKRLGAVAKQHGVEQATLDSWFAEVSAPEAVPLATEGEEFPDAPERPGREGVYEPSGGAGRERRVSGASGASDASAIEGFV